MKSPRCEDDSDGDVLAWAAGCNMEWYVMAAMVIAAAEGKDIVAAAVAVAEAAAPQHWRRVLRGGPRWKADGGDDELQDGNYYAALGAALGPSADDDEEEDGVVVGAAVSGDDDAVPSGPVAVEDQGVGSATGSPRPAAETKGPATVPDEVAAAESEPAVDADASSSAARASRSATGVACVAVAVAALALGAIDGEAQQAPAASDFGRGEFVEAAAAAQVVAEDAQVVGVAQLWSLLAAVVVAIALSDLRFLAWEALRMFRTLVVAVFVGVRAVDRAVEGSARLSVASVGRRLPVEDAAVVLVGGIVGVAVIVAAITLGEPRLLVDAAAREVQQSLAAVLLTFSARLLLDFGGGVAQRRGDEPSSEPEPSTDEGRKKKRKKKRKTKPKTGAPAGRATSTHVEPEALGARLRRVVGECDLAAVLAPLGVPQFYALGRSLVAEARRRFWKWATRDSHRVAAAYCRAAAETLRALASVAAAATRLRSARKTPKCAKAWSWRYHAARCREIERPEVDGCLSEEDETTVAALRREIDDAVQANEWSTAVEMKTLTRKLKKKQPPAKRQVAADAALAAKAKRLFDSLKAADDVARSVVAGIEDTGGLSARRAVALRIELGKTLDDIYWLRWDAAGLPPPVREEFETQRLAVVDCITKAKARLKGSKWRPPPKTSTSREKQRRQKARARARPRDAAPATPGVWTRRLRDLARGCWSWLAGAFASAPTQADEGGRSPPFDEEGLEASLLRCLARVWEWLRPPLLWLRSCWVESGRVLAPPPPWVAGRPSPLDEAEAKMDAVLRQLRDSKAAIDTFRRHFVTDTVEALRSVGPGRVPERPAAARAGATFSGAQTDRDGADADEGRGTAEDHRHHRHHGHRRQQHRRREEDDAAAVSAAPGALADAAAARLRRATVREATTGGGDDDDSSDDDESSDLVVNDAHDEQQHQQQQRQQQLQQRQPQHQHQQQLRHERPPPRANLSLYAALVVGLGLDEFLDGPGLRRELHKAMETEADFDVVVRKWDVRQRTARDFAADQRRYSSGGGFVEVAVAARLYGARVVVYQREDDGARGRRWVFPGGEGHTTVGLLRVGHGVGATFSLATAQPAPVPQSLSLYEALIAAATLPEQRPDRLRHQLLDEIAVNPRFDALVRRRTKFHDRRSFVAAQRRRHGGGGFLELTAFVERFGVCVELHAGAGAKTTIRPAASRGSGETVVLRRDGRGAFDARYDAAAGALGVPEDSDDDVVGGAGQARGDLEEEANLARVLEESAEEERERQRAAQPPAPDNDQGQQRGAAAPSARRPRASKRPVNYAEVHAGRGDDDDDDEACAPKKPASKRPKKPAAKASSPTAQGKSASSKEKEKTTAPDPKQKRKKPSATRVDRRKRQKAPEQSQADAMDLVDDVEDDTAPGPAQPGERNVANFLGAHIDAAGVPDCVALEVRSDNAPSAAMALASPPGGHRGLANLGNTCFINAAVQCVAVVPQILARLGAAVCVRERKEGVSLPEFQIESRCLDAFRNAVAAVRQGGDAFSPTELHDALKELWGHYDGSTQEDPALLLGDLFSLVKSSRLVGCPVAVRRTRVDDTNARSTTHKEQREPIITMNVMGVCCPEEREGRDTAAPEPPDKRATNTRCSVQDFLNDLRPDSLRTENLEDGTTRTEELMPTAPGQCLVVRVNVFSYDSTVKLTTAVDVDPTVEVGPRAEPVRARLVGVIVHIGKTLQSGHYVAYVREGGAWFYKDDSSTTFEGTGDLPRSYAEKIGRKDSSTPYVLFYELLDPRSSAVDAEDAVRLRALAEVPALRLAVDAKGETLQALFGASDPTSSANDQFHELALALGADTDDQERVLANAYNDERGCAKDAARFFDAERTSDEKQLPQQGLKGDAMKRALDELTLVHRRVHRDPENFVSDIFKVRTCDDNTTYVMSTSRSQPRGADVNPWACQRSWLLLYARQRRSADETTPPIGHYFVAAVDTAEETVRFYDSAAGVSNRNYGVLGMYIVGTWLREASEAHGMGARWARRYEYFRVVSEEPVAPQPDGDHSCGLYALVRVAMSSFARMTTDASIRDRLKRWWGSFEGETPTFLPNLEGAVEFPASLETSKSDRWLGFATQSESGITMSADTREATDDDGDAVMTTDGSKPLTWPTVALVVSRVGPVADNAPDDALVVTAVAGEDTATADQDAQKIGDFSYVLRAVTVQWPVRDDAGATRPVLCRVAFDPKSQKRLLWFDDHHDDLPELRKFAAEASENGAGTDDQAWPQVEGMRYEEAVYERVWPGAESSDRHACRQRAIGRPPPLALPAPAAAPDADLAAVQAPTGLAGRHESNPAMVAVLQLLETAPIVAAWARRKNAAYGIDARAISCGHVAATLTTILTCKDTAAEPKRIGTEKVRQGIHVLQHRHLQPPNATACPKQLLSTLLAKLKDELRFRPQQSDDNGAALSFLCWERASEFVGDLDALFEYGDGEVTVKTSDDRRFFFVCSRTEDTLSTQTLESSVEHFQLAGVVVLVEDEDESVRGTFGVFQASGTQSSSGWLLKKSNGRVETVQTPWDYTRYVLAIYQNTKTDAKAAIETYENLVGVNWTTHHVPPDIMREMIEHHFDGAWVPDEASRREWTEPPQQRGVPEAHRAIQSDLNALREHGLATLPVSPRGIHNSGSTCSINAGIQMLLAVPAVRVFLEKRVALYHIRIGTEQARGMQTGHWVSGTQAAKRGSVLLALVNGLHKAAVAGSGEESHSNLDDMKIILGKELKTCTQGCSVGHFLDVLIAALRRDVEFRAFSTTHSAIEWLFLFEADVTVGKFEDDVGVVASDSERERKGCGYHTAVVDVGNAKGPTTLRARIGEDFSRERNFPQHKPSGACHPKTGKKPKTLTKMTITAASENIQFIRIYRDNDSPTMTLNDTLELPTGGEGTAQYNLVGVATASGSHSIAHVKYGDHWYTCDDRSVEKVEDDEAAMRALWATSATAAIYVRSDSSITDVLDLKAPRTWPVASQSKRSRHKKMTRPSKRSTARTIAGVIDDVFDKAKDEVKRRLEMHLGTTSPDSDFSNSGAWDAASDDQEPTRGPPVDSAVGAAATAAPALPVSSSTSESVVGGGGVGEATAGPPPSSDETDDDGVLVGGARPATKKEKRAGLGDAFKIGGDKVRSLLGTIDWAVDEAYQFDIRPYLDIEDSCWHGGEPQEGWFHVGSNEKAALTNVALLTRRLTEKMFTVLVACVLKKVSSDAPDGYSLRLNRAADDDASSTGSRVIDVTTDVPSADDDGPGLTSNDTKVTVDDGTTTWILQASQTTTVSLTRDAAAGTATMKVASKGVRKDTERDCAILPLAMVWLLDKIFSDSTDAITEEALNKAQSEVFTRENANLLRRQFKDLLGDLADRRRSKRAQAKADAERGTEKRGHAAYLSAMLTKAPMFLGGCDLVEAIRSQGDLVYEYHDFLERNVLEMVQTVIREAFDSEHATDYSVFEHLFTAEGWIGAVAQLHTVIKASLLNRPGETPNVQRLKATAAFREVWERHVRDIVMPYLDSGDYDVIVKVAKLIPTGQEGKLFFATSAEAHAPNMRMIVTDQLYWYCSRFCRMMGRWCDGGGDGPPIHFQGDARKFAEAFLQSCGSSVPEDDAAFLDNDAIRELIEDSDALYAQRAASKASEKQDGGSDGRDWGEMYRLRRKYSDCHTEILSDDAPRDAKTGAFALKFAVDKKIILEDGPVKPRLLPFDQLCVALMKRAFPTMFDVLEKGSTKDLRKQRSGEQLREQKKTWSDILVELLWMNEKFREWYNAAKAAKEGKDGQTTKKKAKTSSTSMRTRAASEESCPGVNERYDEYVTEVEKLGLTWDDDDDDELPLNNDDDDDDDELPLNNDDDDDDDVVGGARTSQAAAAAASQTTKTPKGAKPKRSQNYMLLKLSRSITLSPQSHGYSMYFFGITRGTFPMFASVCCQLAGTNVTSDQVQGFADIDDVFCITGSHGQRLRPSYDRTVWTNGVGFRWLVNKVPTGVDAAKQPTGADEDDEEPARSYMPTFDHSTPDLDDDDDDQKPQVMEMSDDDEEEEQLQSGMMEMMGDDDEPLEEEQQQTAAMAMDDEDEQQQQMPATDMGDDDEICGAGPSATTSAPQRGGKDAKAAEEREKEEWLEERLAEEREKHKAKVEKHNEQWGDTVFDDIYAVDPSPRHQMLLHIYDNIDGFDLMAKHQEYERRRGDERRLQMEHGTLDDDPYCPKHAGVIDITVGDYYGHAGIKRHVNRRNAGWAHRNDKTEEELEEMELEALDEDEKKVIYTVEGAVQHWHDMIKGWRIGFRVENTKNRRRDREKLRAHQQRWIDMWVKRLAPPGKKVMFMIGNYASKWLGPKQPIIFGGNFGPMKGLFATLKRQPNVACYEVDEHGTSNTCSNCGCECQPLMRQRTKNGGEGREARGAMRCKSKCCRICWHRDINAAWNIAWKGLTDLYPETYPPERLFKRLTPNPRDCRRFKTRVPDVEDRYAQKPKGHYHDALPANELLAA